MEDRNESSKRRGFIRKLIGLGGAGAVLGLLQGNVSIPKVEAANGDNLKIGTTNTGTADTKLQSSSTDVFIGQATATSGVTSGLRGRSDSTSGRGVYGWASASTGDTRGVHGKSDSSGGFGATGGIGVYGEAPASSGTTRGVYGVSASTSGTGVHGIASARSGTTYGVYGESNSTGGRGVYGFAFASSGTNYGVMGMSQSASGTGVYGWTSYRSGTNYGVYGKCLSASGVGVYAYNDAAGGQALKCHGHAVPDADNAYNCGQNGARWKLVRAVTVTPGDLVFENGYRVTEDEKAGLAFKNDAGEKIAALDRQGNLHIKGKIIQDL